MEVQAKIISQEKLRSHLARRMRSVYVPAAVYRLQLNSHFTFKRAAALLEYFKELGVDALYFSPYFQAAPGSLHGYDLVDPNRINTEIGSESDFEDLSRRLEDLGISQVLDIVPNHMGVAGNNNFWWNDVLENGPSSLYAAFFDIEWEPVKAELKDKILIPVLGDLYGRVLENQEIRISFSSSQFFIHYHEHRFPVDPKTYPILLEHRMDDLQKSLGENSAEFLEYLSVSTAFKNLPPRTEQEPGRMRERGREKEAAKTRLLAVVERHEPIRRFIESNVEHFNGKKGDLRSLDLLDGFLNAQVYRLSFWRVAAEEINYRRFFNINELAAIRIEDERVFREHHKLLFQLIRRGIVRGLRVDHPDGLYDPPTYFRRLQRECVLQLILKDLLEEAGAGRENGALDEASLRGALDEILERDYRLQPPFFIAVEKILDRNEPLPDDWYVNGTVGYDFLNPLNGLFVDSGKAGRFGEIYEGFIGHPIDFDRVVYDKKKFFALVHMASEINALGHRLDLISERDRHYRDFTRNNLTLAIREVIACFPVYRTYLSSNGSSVSERDAKYIQMAVAKAKAMTPALDPAVYDFLEKVLLLRLDPDLGKEDEALYRDFVLRFQQLTGPIMAKGLEDTAFYVYNRLVSLNEVGGDPFHFGYAKDEFHRFVLERSQRWPLGMTSTSTHDTKRSEDVRARVNVLTEMPEEWAAKISKWALLNEKHKTSLESVPEPRRNTEYFIYQTLLGAWPEEGPDGADDHFRERVWQYLLKAVREAHIYTSWAQPNLKYEEAVKKFLADILSRKSGGDFLADFLPFQKKIAFFGKLNSVSTLILKIGCPGVMDTYQGTELIDLSLVDPDNRRPVDFDTRVKMLLDLKAEIRSGGSAAGMYPAYFKDPKGKIKLFVLWKGLGARKTHRELFTRGEYIPLTVRGKRERNIVAFMRKWGDQTALVATTRFFSELIPSADAFFPPASAWGDTEIILPKLPRAYGKFTDIFSGRELHFSEKDGAYAIKAAEFFKEMNGSIGVTTHAP